jgi:4'-phosphopantetheinyl transferase
MRFSWRNKNLRLLVRIGGRPHHARMLAGTGTVAKLAEPLGDDEVHVWRLVRARADGRAPLLALLGAYLDVPASRVALTTAQHGRPALADDSGRGLDFNWSHSGDAALLAVARGVAPGIDIERMRPRPRALDIARRYFSAAEADGLAALPEVARSLAFLRLWTAKEAVLKALGRGLAFGLQRLEIALDEDVPHLRRLHGERVSDWQLHALAPDDGYVATLAWRGSPRRIRQFRLPQDAPRGTVVNPDGLVAATEPAS